MQKSWPASFAPGDWYTGSPVYAASGTELAVGSTAGLELVSNTGRALRSLPAPAGRSRCTPRRWWTSSELLASCMSAATSVDQLWLFPVSGARPAALTASPAAQGDYGDETPGRCPAARRLAAAAPTVSCSAAQEPDRILSARRTQKFGRWT